jgi:hypothetical protein
VRSCSCPESLAEPEATELPMRPAMILTMLTKGDVDFGR